MSHSSCVRRKALRSAASCLASLVLPAPGNPQVRISRASLMCLKLSHYQAEGSRGSPPDDLVARLEGKSSLGRLGLLIHSTAGYVDPGWDGYLTLELSNVANLPITIYPGMKIGQISFFRLTSAAERPYGSKDRGSKYQGQRGPTASRFFEEFTAEGSKQG